MNRRYINLIIIVILLAGSIWIALPNNPGIEIGSFKRSLKTVLGLDLRGGMQVLLEADVPQSQAVDAQSLDDARQILENRSNGLGVSEVVFQVAGARRIVGEFPGLTNTDQVVAVLKEVGQLEFVGFGDTILPEGTIIKTDFATGSTDTSAGATPEATATAAATETPSATTTPAAAASTEPTATPTEEKVWHTIMTGTELKSVAVTTDQLGKYVVSFQLKDDGKKIFADYTTKNVGKILAIVLDKKVISTPKIETQITQGQGQISGSFTYDSANELAVQLRYGSLPVPLKVVESRVIGPTLGEDSLNKSIIAGIIGFIIVFLFMAIYYRLPGVVADISIIFFALFTYAIYTLIPVTLTLPGIAGFLLSTGSALDANILIFERLKEELSGGRNFLQAVDLAWKRAWPSIRDSNIATLITSLILFWFGSTYGATTVKGFAFTLAIGVVVSLFTAIVVTRTNLTLLIEWMKPTVKQIKWFGVID